MQVPGRSQALECLHRALEGSLKQPAPLSEVFHLHRMIGNNRGIAMALNNLGQTEWFLGHYEKARSLLEESLALRRSLSDKRGAALALLNLGNLSRDTGDTVAALDRLSESAGLCAEIGFAEIEVYAHASLGRALIRNRSCIEQTKSSRRVLRDAAV